jgi:hypothetical protein
MEPTSSNLTALLQRHSTLVALAVILLLSALAATNLEPRLSRRQVQDIRYRNLGVGTSLSEGITKLGHATEDRSYRFGQDLLVKRWGKHGPIGGFDKRQCVYMDYLSEIELVAETGTFKLTATMDPDDVRGVLGMPNRGSEARYLTEIYDFPEIDQRLEITYYYIRTCTVFGMPIYATEVTGWFRVSQMSEPKARSYRMQSFLARAPSQ